MKKFVKCIAIVMVVSAIISYFSFFRTEVTLDGGVEYRGEVVNSDISIEDDYISISSFVDAIMGYEWIGEDELVIKGNHESEGISNYKFDNQDVNLEKLDLELDSIILSDLEYEVIYRLDYYDLILSRDLEDYSEIYIYKDEKLSKIGSLKKMDEKPLIVSKDNSKILYLNKDNQINTYSTISSRKKSSIMTFENSSSIDFFNQFKISNDGGYFSYCLLSDNYSESSFYIYGADSGKLYAKDIIGVSPSFSTYSDKVAFFYSGDVKSNILIKSRVGVLSLKSKKITYYDRTDEGEAYFSDLKWTSDNEKIVFTSSLNKKNEINILDISNMVKFNYNVSEVDLNDNLQVIANKIYWFSKDGEKNQLSILETTGKSPVYVENIRSIDVQKEKNLISIGDDVYVIQGNYLLLVSGDMIRQILYIDENSKLLSISPKGGSMLVEKNVDGKIELRIYKIDKEK